ncbi:MAG TPA: DNA repair helicase XPB [Planctomycetota bacterium]|nr:DNA repair helicase XPB [Planctomycetota bacterium]
MTAPSPPRGENPLIVQGDRSLLLDVHAPLAEEARGVVARFAELERSPEHFHTYRITPLSLWNAAASGLDAGAIVSSLERFSRYPVPENVLVDVRDLLGRYGRLRIVGEGDGTVLALQSEDPALLLELSRRPGVRDLLGERLSPRAFRVPLRHRGTLKQALLAAGWPAEDLAGYLEGTPLRVALRAGRFEVRAYQREAAEAFFAGGGERGGSGVVVLPCGAGKTIVGLLAMSLVNQTTLVLTTGGTAVAQWRREILEKTEVRPDEVAEYTGERKDVGPVTLTTYQMLTHRASRAGDFPHLRLFQEREWGLIVYDEVHLLPAPVFRATAEVQARRRLGLTATLVREDGLEGDVFTLIGPKKYDAPWRDLEAQGWIAEATCTEVRCALPSERRMEYALAPERGKFRIAAENPVKLAALREVLASHPGARTLVIGQFLDQLRGIADALGAPLVVGATSGRERERLYGEFRAGRVPLLVLSKVGNFALDLPDADLLVQVSGTFGSRQEEAQRLGRVLRPKGDGRAAHFYTLVTRDTQEQDFALHRQLFLTEQGYAYRIREPEAAGSPA